MCNNNYYSHQDMKMHHEKVLSKLTNVFFVLEQAVWGDWVWLNAYLENF